MSLGSSIDCLCRIATRRLPRRASTIPISRTTFWRARYFFWSGSRARYPSSSGVRRTHAKPTLPWSPR